MRDDISLCAKKTWPAIVRAVALIVVQVGLLKPLPRPKHLELLRLVRRAESMARRWLVIKATEKRENTALSPVHALGIAQSRTPLAPREAQPLSAVRSQDIISPRYPRFRLTEPEPKLSPHAYAFITERNSLEPVSCEGEARNGTCFAPLREALSAGQNQTSPPLNHTNLWTRSRGLYDVIQRPNANIKRMARWLARAASKTGSARRTPLRPGRPKGLLKTRCKRDRLVPDPLRDLNFFAREELEKRPP